MTPLGLTLGFFKHFVNVHGGRQAFQGLTSEDVCTRYVIPFTTSSELSLVDHVYRHHPKRCDFVKPATWFVSHAWQYLFLDVMDALDNFFDENGDDGDPVAVWFCMFNNNQHEVSGHERSVEYWIAKFKDALTAIGKVVMVFSPWNSPTTLTRTWCVFEVFIAMETNARFEVAMGKTEKEAFLADAASSSEDVFIKALSKINCSKSFTAVPSDRDFIFEIIQRGPGFIKVDRVVFEVLEHWVRRTLDKQIELASTREERIRWRLLKQTPSTDYTASELYFKASIELNDDVDSISTRGPFHWEAVMWLAVTRYRLNRPRELWEQSFKDALANLSALLGSDHAKVITAKMLFSESYFAKQDFTRGMTLLYECFASAHRQWGDSHLTTMDIMNQIGLHLCIHVGRLDEGAKWLERAYQASIKRYAGDEIHSFVIRCCLALCYHRQGRYVEAIALARINYEQCLRTRDPSDQTTAHALRWLCEFLRNQGLYDNLEADLHKCLQVFQDIGDDVLIVQCKLKQVMNNTHMAEPLGRRILGELYLAMGYATRAKVAFDDVLPKFQLILGATDTYTRFVLYSHLVLDTVEDTINSIEAVTALDIEFTKAEVCGETWFEFVCHGCYEEIRGKLHMCPDCPRHSLRFCYTCVQDRIYEPKCCHNPSDWIRLSPPMRYLHEKRLQLLAEAKDWSAYGLHYQAYKDYCSQQDVPNEEQVKAEMAFIANTLIDVPWSRAPASKCTILQ
ncbi:Aste57867_375 [Aphanomyces stellatus]|uniref:Aste57867_375 protein n=1 Tax=Aphanomyces stellatus TaxID=120398 RepID=A0A485K4Y5_9STRA|nr:hypothetical protein As57867_000374 [Aphanomyces stellatus]VFT77600.1 Aste57867_375 [Aphanomyces stellatus]